MPGYPPNSRITTEERPLPLRKGNGGLDDGRGNLTQAAAACGDFSELSIANGQLCRRTKMVGDPTRLFDPAKIDHLAKAHGNSVLESLTGIDSNGNEFGP